MLRDIAEAHGVVTLTQLVRFHNPAEGAATESTSRTDRCNDRLAKRHLPSAPGQHERPPRPAQSGHGNGLGSSTA